MGASRRCALLARPRRAGYRNKSLLDSSVIRPFRPLHRFRALAVLALLIAPGRLVAQAELQGRVLAETARRPIANATVAVLTLGLRTMTDSLGRFRLSTIPRGEH